MPCNDRCSYAVLTYRGGVVDRRNDTVVVEHELTIYLNGQKFISLLCTPRSLRELIVGFLHSEGIIKHAADIAQLHLSNKGGQAHIQLPNMDTDLSARVRTVTTAGGHGGQTLEINAARIGNDPLSCTLSLDPVRLCRRMETFGTMSDLFQQTGGAHSCALSDGSDILFFEDDIGRHNALDKIIGHTVLQSMAVDDKVILTSGRVSSEIVAKVSRRGIRAIVSRSAPTGRAIDLARSVGMILIGFVRGQSLNVYAGFSCLDDAT